MPCSRVVRALVRVAGGAVLAERMPAGADAVASLVDHDAIADARDPRRLRPQLRRRSPTNSWPRICGLTRRAESAVRVRPCGSCRGRRRCGSRCRRARPPPRAGGRHRGPGTAIAGTSRILACWPTSASTRRSASQATPTVRPRSRTRGAWSPPPSPAPRRGDAADVLEDARADLVDRLGAVDDAAGREVQVARHALEDRRVGRELDDRRDGVADRRAAPRGEDDDLRAGRTRPGVDSWS